MSVETGVVCTIVRLRILSLLFPPYQLTGSITSQDLQGNVLATYKLDRLQINGVVVTSDGQRFLGVGVLLETRDHLRPVKSRPEHRIIGQSQVTKDKTRI